ncbi:hypothetical protein [Candidatus Harpocratesius sp.]
MNSGEKIIQALYSLTEQEANRWSKTFDETRNNPLFGTFSVSEVAARARLSPSTIRKWIPRLIAENKIYCSRYSRVASANKTGYYETLIKKLKIGLPEDLDQPIEYFFNERVIS